MPFDEVTIGNCRLIHGDCRELRHALQPVDNTMTKPETSSPPMVVGPDRKVMPPTLLHGDCLDLMATIESGSVDAIICDLPYGTTDCKWDTVIPFETLWEQYKRVIKPNGAIVLFGSEPFSSLLRVSNLKQYRYDWTWDKVTARGHLVAKKRPMAQSECISVFYANAPTYNPQMVKRPTDKIEVRKTTEYARTEIMGGVSNAPVNRVYDEWYPKTIITMSNAGSSVKSVHPTQKPVPLCEYLIRTYTNEGDTVLDNCMGSGTTGIACLNTGRNFIGIEKDAGYFEIARNRIEGHNVGAERRP